MQTAFGRVQCFKAYRSPWETAQLDFSRVSRNMMAGVQTQLMLDTNIVIDMEKCCDDAAAADDSTLDKWGLLEWVNFLRECNRLGLKYYLSPFFALQEQPADQILGAANAIDVFPRKFGLCWLDDKAALSPELANVGRRVSEARFEGMRDRDRTFFSNNYAGLLLMLLVARDSSDRTPFVTFMRYLRLYRRRIDMISMRILSIARLVFAPPPPSDSEFYATWKGVVLNFTQRKSLTQRLPKTAHHMDKAALNGAHDLMLLDASLVAEAKGLEGVPVDPWIVSADRKLSGMLEIMHHTALSKRHAGQYLSVVSLAHHGEYWARTEEVLSQLGDEARLNMAVRWDIAERRALGVVALAANGLYGGEAGAAYQRTQILTTGGGRSA